MNRRKLLSASATAANSPLSATAPAHLARAGAPPCHLGAPEAGHWAVNIDNRTIELIEDKESDNENF